ncbi:MAG: CHAT domain-containing tetratricopeptide repeat protein [Saprospiraceae bacterium]
MIVIICFVLFANSIVTANNIQNIDSTDSKGLYYFKKAKEAIEMEDFESALNFHLKAIPFLVSEKKAETYCEVYIELSVLYHQKKELNKALDFGLLAKQTIEEEIGKNSHLYGICLYNLGTYYFDKRNIEKALIYEKEAVNHLENSNSEPETQADILNNLALTQEIIGDYTGAISNIEKALRYQFEIYGPINHETAWSYYSLGVIYLSKKEYLRATTNFLKNYRILKQLGKNGIEVNDVKLINVFQRLANSYQYMKYSDSTEYYLAKALDLQKEDNSYRKYLSYEVKAKLLSSQNQIEKAKYIANEAIRLAKISFNDFNKHPVIARQYTHLAEIFQQNNELDSAVTYFHKAFLFLAHDFEEEDVYKNPKAEQCFPEIKVIRSLKGKARALYLRYQQSKDQRDLIASLETYELTHDFIGRLKQDISTMGSKQQLAGDVLDVYEGAIETAIALYEATGDQQYLEKGLFFAEANKAILLLESINERMAQEASGIPDSLLEKEKQYRVDIAYYERSINEENNKKGEPDVDNIKKWGDLLYRLKREYQQLVDQFEEEYPRYFQLKYDTRLATLGDIRSQMLDRKTAFLEYFVGLDKIFLFQITKKDFQVFSLNKPAGFKTDINQALQWARTQQISDEQAAELDQLLHRLYIDYMAIALKQLPATINRLFIIPDDLFNTIPFEILFTTQPKPGKKSHYLIHDFNIGYAYSATLFKTSQQRQRKVANKGFLGFAPSFSTEVAELRSCSGSILANLINSQNEITSIQQLMGGDVLMGNQANRDFFLEQAPHYKIIHLATHACMDEENAMQSKVFFADEPIINQELFNLQLSADLAVLSACNTGSGQLVTGDGVMSLSKGFVHAGCPSALMSLWSVDDYSTSQIMINFYKYLKKGQTKDQAIRQAKLDFLGSADKVRQHPFFWAAFVQMGDPIALQLGGNIGNGWWIGLIGLLGLIAAMYWRRSREETCC